MIKALVNVSDWKLEQSAQLSKKQPIAPFLVSVKKQFRQTAGKEVTLTIESEEYALYDRKWTGEAFIHNNPDNAIKSIALLWQYPK